MFQKISDALLGILANSKIQNIFDYEASDLEGTPALTLTASGNENDYSTTTENRRVYAFLIRLFVKRASGKSNEELCEDTMRDLVDTVLDDIDKSHTALAPTSQTGYTFLFMSAAPSKWGYAGRESEHRVAEIVVRVHYDVDTTAIS